MITLLTASRIFTLIFTMSFIHRMRGGDPWVPHLRNPMWMWVGIPPLLIVMGAWWPVALTWGIGWMLWSLPGWMRLISEVGVVKFKAPVNDAWGTGRPLTWDERFIETLTPGFDPYLKLFVRGLVWLLPLILVLPLLTEKWWAALLIPFGFTFSYGIAWVRNRKDGADVCLVGEALTGAFWGIAMALCLFL